MQPYTCIVEEAGDEFETLCKPALENTILLVSECEEFYEVMRKRVLNSGGRVRRCDGLNSFQRHLQIYEPDHIIIDPAISDFKDCLEYLKNRVKI